MDEPDGALQTRTEDEDASPFDMLPRYGEYDWMSDPERRLVQDSNGHQSTDAPYSPEYEPEPGLSPDSNLQGANFPTPTSIGQNFVMPTTPSESAFQLSNGMSPCNDPNSTM